MQSRFSAVSFETYLSHSRYELLIVDTVYNVSTSLRIQAYFLKIVLALQGLGLLVPMIPLQETREQLLTAKADIYFSGDQMEIVKSLSHAGNLL